MRRRRLRWRKINFKTLKSSLSNLWLSGRGVFIHEFGPKFFHSVDRNRVIEGGPWSFSNHLLVTHLLQPGEVSLEVPFHTTLFWIQIRNLPLGYMNSTTTMLLGDFVDCFLAYDLAVCNRGWQSFMHIRGEIDIKLPLKRTKRIVTRNNQSFTLEFKYERLPIFCFLCSRLGHNKNFVTRFLRGWVGMNLEVGVLCWSRWQDNPRCTDKR